MEPWLTRSDFAANIGDVPPTFDLTRHLSAIIGSVVRTWLTDLLGTDQVETLRAALEASKTDTPTELSDDNKKWIDQLIPFLCNAVWSEYILRGNVSITDTGPVTKLSDGVEPISDQQRAQLHRFYKGQAEYFAIALQKLRTATNCGEPARSLRPQVRAVGGKRYSRF